jgi:MarR family 2-MHQ and catechol resistance regulon transcriptional repressor
VTLRRLKEEAGLNEVGRTLLEALSRLAVTQTRAATRAARRAGISLTSYGILVELALDGPLTNGQLADRRGMSSGGVTPALDRLQAQGLLERKPNPSDRRSSVVSITEDGRDVVRCGAPVMVDELGEAVADLDPEELRAVLGFLSAAHEAYAGANERLEAVGS